MSAMTCIMDENQDNLKTLKEMILDEEKLVTYVSVSKELCLHVNVSKHLLTQAVHEIKKKLPNVELNINYIISGLTGDNKSRTTVCSEVEIDTIRKTYITVFFEHIYSVSRGLPSVENASFLAVNKFDDFPLCIGLIKSNQCVKRTSEEIGNLITNSQQFIVSDQKVVPPPLKKIKEENKDIVINGHGKGVEINEKFESVVKTEIPSPKKGLMNTNKTKETKQKNGHKIQKHIAGFFNKASSVSLKKTKENGTNGNNVNIEKQGNIDLDNVKEKIVKKEHKDVDDESVKTELVKIESKEENDSSLTKNKSLNEIKKNAKIDKKRKRVLHILDSESEDENNDLFLTEAALENDSADEIPPTPAVNTVKITSGIVNSKKRRKIVDKTYIDDDEGYILTKKEEKYESCSENEEMDIKETIIETHHDNKDNMKDMETKSKVSLTEKKSAKNNMKKISPPNKGKQATLTSYFKKT